MDASFSRIAAIAAALWAVNACGAISRGDPDAAVPGTAGAAGTTVHAPLERCYVLADATDRARIERDASGMYAVTEGSFRTNSFDEDQQELILIRGTTGNGERRLEVHLAADNTVADADFVDCVDSSKTQLLCYMGSPMPTRIADCSGNAVSVPDFSGCYAQSGGGFRVQLSGFGTQYQALVSRDGGSAVPWTAHLGLNSLTVIGENGSSSIQFLVGSTGRLWASASLPDGDTHFVACDAATRK